MWAVTAESKYRVRDLCPGRQDCSSERNPACRGANLICGTALSFLRSNSRSGPSDFNSFMGRLGIEPRTY